VLAAVTGVGDRDVLADGDNVVRTADRLLMPITWPAVLISAPPELPGLIAVSVWSAPEIDVAEVPGSSSVAGFMTVAPSCESRELHRHRCARSMSG
jgi:hypothetical protein